MLGVWLAAVGMWACLHPTGLFANAGVAGLVLAAGCGILLCHRR